MERKIKNLQTILDAEAFILTGSAALMYYGLVSPDKVGDLDIVLINPTDSARKVLDNMQASQPNTRFVPGGRVAYSFIYDGVKTDVWVESKDTYKPGILTEDGVRLANIAHIVREKKKINRAKDWIQLIAMGRLIYDPNDFAKALPTISEVGY